jgi:hypothetical protein
MVATAEPEAGQRRLEPLHIAGAVDQLPADAIENLHGDFAIDGAQIGTGFR